MTITLNGKTHSEFEKPVSVSALLKSLGLAGGAPVLVELDGEALRPRDFPDQLVEDGAVLEIIRVAAGG